MLLKTINIFFRRIADLRLTAAVHFDAFWGDPNAYLTATKWWIKRKRVRARNQFATLLGRSPKAYQLWISRHRQHEDLCPSIRLAPPIIALIDLTDKYDPNGLVATQESLKAEGIIVLLVGGVENPTLASVIDSIDWITSPWLFPLRVGDRIASGAASAYRAAMDNPCLRVIYADDDLLIESRRHSPYFKPDWNGELFKHQDYLTGACMVRANQSDLEGVVSAPEWAARLVAGLVGKGMPLHLQEILHHRRNRPAQHLPVRPLDVARGLPPISVIVPTRNRVDLLRTCLAGIAAAEYPEVEVIVVDNDSNDPETLAYLSALDSGRYKVLHHSGVFNYSAINNRAAGEAKGKLICLLNNDIEVTDSQWLSKLATQALRHDVGAVGARLLYPDGRIQHAGVVIGVGDAAAHAHRFLKPDEEGYFHRHNLPQFTMAVTAACLVVNRDKFWAVGGLNEKDFAVAFNDVDLCLRLNQRGWHSLYEPRATLIHHESVSRGLDCDPIGAARFAQELAALKRLWKTDAIFDPYLHPQLSRASEQFAVAL